MADDVSLSYTTYSCNPFSSTKYPPGPYTIPLPCLGTWRSVWYQRNVRYQKPRSTAGYSSTSHDPEIHRFGGFHPGSVTLAMPRRTRGRRGRKLQSAHSGVFEAPLIAPRLIVEARIDPTASAPVIEAPTSCEVTPPRMMGVTGRWRELSVRLHTGGRCQSP